MFLFGVSALLFGVFYGLDWLVVLIIVFLIATGFGGLSILVLRVVIVYRFICLFLVDFGYA